jgi:hypothetical protein
MIEKIYFISIFLITVFVVYLYFAQYQDYNKEMAKIESLEKEYEHKQKELEAIRSKTTPCNISNLDTPRKCYIDSGYQCSWNADIQRCDKL